MLFVILTGSYRTFFLDILRNCLSSRTGIEGDVEKDDARQEKYRRVRIVSKKKSGFPVKAVSEQL
jgi:hypothetical protein